MAGKHRHGRGRAGADRRRLPMRSRSASARARSAPPAWSPGVGVRSHRILEARRGLPRRRVPAIRRRRASNIPAISPKALGRRRRLAAMIGSAAGRARPDEAPGRGSSSTSRSYSDGWARSALAPRRRRLPAGGRELLTECRGIELVLTGPVRTGGERLAEIAGIFDAASPIARHAGGAADLGGSRMAVSCGTPIRRPRGWCRSSRADAI